jgi:hypothetical protein
MVRMGFKVKRLIMDDHKAKSVPLTWGYGKRDGKPMVPEICSHHPFMLDDDMI